jgi:hypothetical protein
MLGQILGGVASGLLGGIFGQKASDNASSRQANAMAESTAMQVAENRRQFDKMLELTAPSGACLARQASIYRTTPARALKRT